MHHPRYFAVAVALVFSGISGVAWGQAKEPAGYSYDFEDDALLGDTLSSPPPIIKGHRRGVRVTLLRPRASFVAEMLKSVEAL
jgi:hypothetical protein